MTFNIMSKKFVYEAPAFPRVVVSAARHKALAAEAHKLGITMTELAEKKLKAK